MKISSRSALSPGLRPPRSGVLLLALLALACVAGCVADPGTPQAAAPTSDPQALAADLNARLDALQRQAEPASDDVIASLERTLREQREKRARAVVAAGTTSVIPAGSSAGVAAASVPPKPAAPAAVAAASGPAPVANVDVASTATLLRAVDQVPPPAIVHTNAATVTGPVRTPMSRTPESHMPVDELYERARALEVQLQVIPAIGLYREASQRGHAPSSQRLMELYADGAPGVARDYRVAVFFKERAVQQGASFDPVWRR